MVKIKILQTQAHFQFYALLLLSDMKWEVAYSTLCTEKKNIFFRNLYINLQMAGLHFHKPDLRHHSHTNTQIAKHTSIRSERSS